MFKRLWLRDLLIAVVLIFAFIGLLVNPKETSSAAQQGISLCLDVIIPSLFPFFVLSSLIIELGFAAYIGRAFEGIMRPAFNVSGACSTALVLGFLGGYPVGAKTAVALYEKKMCTKVETERLLAFCNNSGPAFILGAVGAGILGSSSAGWLLYLTHTAASLTVGLLFRFYKRGSSPSESGVRQPYSVTRLSTAFTSSVGNSFQSVFGICAFVIFFTVIIRLLYITGVLPGAAEVLAGILSPLQVSQQSVLNLLTGLIEITSGLFSLQGSTSQLLAGKMAMAAFMLGWAGLSVHCQVLSFIGKSGLSSRTYVLGKLLHGVISAAYILVIYRVMDFKRPLSVYLAEQVEVIARLNFWDTLGITIKVVCAVGMGYILAAMIMAARRHWRRA